MRKKVENNQKQGNENSEFKIKRNKKTLNPMKENKFKWKVSVLIIWNSRYKLSTTKKSPDNFNALYDCWV